MSRLFLDPYVSLALWVPLALAAAGLLAVYASARGSGVPWRRRTAIILLMGASLAAPLVVLLNPNWSDRVDASPGKPLLTVLIDASASMDVRDGPQKSSRFEEACRIANAAMNDLSERYDVRLRSFAGDSSPIDIQSLETTKPNGNMTDLAAAIESALDSQVDNERSQDEAVLLLSDGGHNVGGMSRLGDAIARAHSQSTPVFTKTIGGAAEVRDLEVEIKRPQVLAFLGQPAAVTVTLRQRGSMAAQATVRLLLAGKEMEKHTARLVPNGTTDEVFKVKQDAVGVFRYEVVVDPLPGEATAANNSASVLLRVVDQPMTLLLPEDETGGSPVQRLISWLVVNTGMAPSQRLILRAEKGTFNNEENVVVSLQIREDRWTGGTPQVELTSSARAESQIIDCKPRSKEPGQYRADFGRLAEGHYRVRVVGAANDEASAEVAFDVRGSLREYLEVAARPDVMTWIAQASGGAELARAEPQELARLFDERIEHSRPERVAPAAAWDRWWLLISVFALWGTTWGLRRRSGLT